jgi:hypothetical protein
MVTFSDGLAVIALAFGAWTVLATGKPYGGFTHHVRMRCPNTGADARVDLETRSASRGGAYGARLTMVRRCSLLRPGETCNESCVKQNSL